MRTNHTLIYRTATVVALLLLFTAVYSHAQNQLCDAITIKKIETKSPEKGSSNGEIIIHTEGGKGTLRFFFFNEKGRPINSNQELKNSVTKLPKGKYKCSIMDEGGCIKIISIELI